MVLADDSGLEVDALDGAPGVRSARFAADAGLTDSPDANDNTDVWNNMVLLQRMATVPAAQRTARYHCVLAAARDGVLCQTADGTVDLDLVMGHTAHDRTEKIFIGCAAAYLRLAAKPVFDKFERHGLGILARQFHLV